MKAEDFAVRATIRQFPGAELLLLTAPFKLSAVAFCGPEMPAPLSGSAQRFMARFLLGEARSALLPEATTGSGEKEEI